MPRYVILEHDHPTTHWDLMLENGESLRTWRLAVPPRAGEATSAVAVFDHRLLYLDYEGPIAGDRGVVIRWDHGTFSGDAKGSKRVSVFLSGKRISGELSLQHQTGEDWTAEFLPDSEARWEGRGAGFSFIP